MTLVFALLMCTAMLFAAAWAGEKNALYIPALVLLCAAAATLLLA